MEELHPKVWESSGNDGGMERSASDSKATQIDTDSVLSDMDIKVEIDVADDLESNLFHPMESEQDQNQTSSIECSEIKLERDEEEDISMNIARVASCNETETEMYLSKQGNLKDCSVYVGPRIDKVMENLWEKNETKMMSRTMNNDKSKDSEKKDDVNYIMRIQPGDELEKLSTCHIVRNANVDMVDQNKEHTASDSGQLKKPKGRRKEIRRRYICGICESSFTVSHQLRIHMRIHTGEKPYKCTLCDKAFVVNSHLTIHMRNHTGERPFKCTKCDMAFTQRCNLTQHLRHHESKKKYKCNLCDKIYTSLSHLREHMTLHMGQKPNPGAICEKASTRHLEKDMRRYKGKQPYQCALCPKAFFESHHLTQHMKVHAGDKPCKPHVPDTRKTLLQFKYL